MLIIDSMFNKKMRLLAFLRNHLIFILLIMVSARSLYGFGQNKVNVHNFRWRVVSTDHFDIHYTLAAEPIIPRAAYYLEKAYRRVTADFGIKIKGRTSFFLLANHNEFEENNIVPVGEGTGGVTEAFKNRFVIFNNGTEFWLDHVIAHEFAHVAQFEILYGGFWKSARLLKSPLYPLWFMEGIAEYVTGDLDRMEEDMYLRDAATSSRLYSIGELHGFNHLKPHQVTLAYKQGASAIRFLADEYGKEKVEQILKNLRERFEISTVLAYATKQNFPQFNQRYLTYTQEYYEEQAQGLQEPESYGERLTLPNILPVFNTNPTFSPDGNFIAFITDMNGPKQIMLFDTVSGRSRILIGTGKKQIENIHSDGRALSFSRDGRWLAFSGEKQQRDYLYLFDLKRNRLRTVRTPFEHIRSPIFHPKEDRLVVVGMERGTNDLYEITPRGKFLKRLTESPNDESDPVYSPEGDRIVFSQEQLKKEHAGRDLMFLDRKTLAVSSLTDIPGMEFSPVFTPDGKSLIFTASGSENIRNLYLLNLEKGTVFQLTRVMGGMFSPSLSKKDKKIVFSSFRRTSMDLYLNNFSFWEKLTSLQPVYTQQPSIKAWNSSRTVTQGSMAQKSSIGPSSSNWEGSPWNPEDNALFRGERRPYRFRASTDLFFPLFYYSSADGLFMATMWQASDYLGNHQLQSSLQYSSGNDFLDYSVQYEYKRFRPQFFIGSSGENFYRDFSRTELKKESRQILGTRYPLNRFNRLELAAGTKYTEETFERFPQFDYRERENFLETSFVRDKTSGRYLAVTTGHRLRLTYRVARPSFNGTREYNSQEFEYHRFTPTGRESTLAFRGLAGVSLGSGPEELRLGGRDRLRGFPRNGLDNQASRYVLTNLEWRIPLRFVDVRGFFLFPDFYVKALYGAVFVDTGYDWRRGRDLNHLKANRLRNSIGGGIRMPTFILQTFPVTLTLDVAKRTDRNQWVWYFSFGPAF